MSNSVAYEVGYAHGARGLPMYRFFTPEAGWEHSQYKQGYIDGRVAYDNDVERERNNYDFRNRSTRLRTVAGA